MKIACISAANVEGAKAYSASTYACQIIRDLIQDQIGPDAEIEILSLIDLEPRPCRMCGRCFETGRCASDEAFNRVLASLAASDAIFVVCPHYALIPSKLVMLLEKMEEMVFLQSCADPAYRFPLAGKPTGIVVHGGQTEEALAYYQSALLEPVANALASVHLRIVGAGESWPKGVAFGIRSIEKKPDSIFVDIEHDWPSIQARIALLVQNVLQVTNPVQ